MAQTRGPEFGDVESVFWVMGAGTSYLQRWQILQTSSHRRLSEPAPPGVPGPGTAEEVVAWLGAVQAQDFAGAKWGDRTANGRA